ncbi:MAG TPA: ECF transporter S component [Candidatus Dormibacteraeota bacterium]|jgi:energy-coupling factor transport system substrate-specific component|nr:ECF transporter S component [Candidatus Dormibacteraeota bacterium]
MRIAVAVASVLGLALFASPFLLGRTAAAAPAYTVAIGVSAGLLLIELGARRLDSRRLALLAALAALDAALRLALINGIGGFSPIFFLILAAGYVFGGSYGFLVGAFSLLVSALVTGGVGPWLPYQMFGAGWVGLAAAIPGRLLRRRSDLLGLAGLAVAGVVMGFAYGALLDVQTWTTGYQGGGALGWSPDLAPAVRLLHFARFYLVTSLAYDIFRAVGNALMVLILGAPVIAALVRLRARFAVEIVDCGR